jgi:hypothetical protein
MSTAIARGKSRVYVPPDPERGARRAAALLARRVRGDSMGTACPFFRNSLAAQPRLQWMYLANQVDIGLPAELPDERS